MDTVTVLPLGTSVIVGLGIDATIAGVWIREKHFWYTQYDVVWWADGQRHSMWLSREEFTLKTEDTETMKVGFGCS